jgi:hypothetical protein
MNEINPVTLGVGEDGPSDFYYPFNRLRNLTIGKELWIARDLRDAIATALEDPTLADDGAKARTALGACLWAIGELEAQLLALREELTNGD